MKVILFVLIQKLKYLRKKKPVTYIPILDIPFYYCDAYLSIKQVNQWKLHGRYFKNISFK